MPNYSHLLLGGTGFIGGELIKTFNITEENGILCVGNQKATVPQEGATYIYEDLHNDAAEWATHYWSNVFILIGQNHAAFNKKQEIAFLTNT